MTFHLMTNQQRFLSCSLVLQPTKLVDAANPNYDDDQVSSISSCPPPKLVDAALVFLPEEEEASLEGEVKEMLVSVSF